MNLNLITYEDKEQINVNADIPEKNKVMADNMNEIKNALNVLIVPKLLNIFYPIGSYYETSDISFDPNISMGGTWELETDGTVLVSKSNTTGSKFNTDVGSVVGAETHTHGINGTTLSIEQLPGHNHTGTTDWAGEHAHTFNGYAPNRMATGNSDYSFVSNPQSHTDVIDSSGSHQHTFTTSYTGSGKAHSHTANASSSVQPSKIVNRWHRTA